MPWRRPRTRTALGCSRWSQARVLAIPVSITLRTAGGVAVAGELSLGDRLVTAHETTLLQLRDDDPLRIAGDGK
jgi:hypothetical protein